MEDAFGTLVWVVVAVGAIYTRRVRAEDEPLDVEQEIVRRIRELS